MGKLIQQSVMPYDGTAQVKRPRLVLIDIITIELIYNFTSIVVSRKQLLYVQ